MNRPTVTLALSALVGMSALAQVPVINSFSVDRTTLPYGGQPTFSWDVTGATTLRISPAVGTVTGATGTATAPVPGLVNLLPANATWKYNDEGIDFGPSDQANTAAAWFNPAFDDSAWFTGTATLSYGNHSDTAADQSKDLRYGTTPTDDPLHPNKFNDPANKITTYYFRTAFGVTAQQLSAAQAIYLNLRRDDGAVVYLNGKEVLRQNLPDGQITALTFGNLAAGGNEEALYFRYPLNKADLVAGTNTLAVEIHQASLTSSDIILAAAVDAIIPSDVTTLVPRASTWKYLDDGSNQGTAWTGAAFNDTAWRSGAGTFGYNNSTSNASGTSAGANTVASYGPDAAAKYITTYFRKVFTATSVADLATFALTANYDDGMVVYLNGTEIARAYIPAGEVTSTTLATGHEGDYTMPALAAGTNVTLASDAVIKAALLEGTNVLAVEVHQDAATSSDLSFNLAFTGTDSASVARTLVKPFDTWRFLDTGADLGTYDGSSLNTNAWVGAAFNDAAWKSGVAEIGYGDGNDNKAPTTVLDYGTDLTAKRLTNYFRKTVTLADLANYANFTLEVFRDDAAAVYVNGTQIYRDTNLPAGAAFDTPATATANGTISVTVPTSAFVNGSNTIAVEVHQESGTSSDVFFDLALYGNVVATSRTYTLFAENASGSATETVTVNFSALPTNPVPLLVSLNGSTSDQPGWNRGEIWLDQLVPTSDKDYQVVPNFARVLVTGGGAANATFGGRTLTLPGRGILVVNNGAGATATVPELILAGGEVQCSFNGTAGTPQQRTLAGLITVTAPSTLNPSGADRIFNIAANITGAEMLTLSSNTVASGSVASTIVLGGDNSGFTGNWDVFTKTVKLASPSALGGSEATPNSFTMHSGGVLDPDVAIVAPHTSVTLRNSGTASQLVLDQNVRVAALTLGTDVVPEGIYTWETLTAAQQAYFVQGTGVLTVGNATGGDSDADGLPDDWELTNLGTLAFGAQDDVDGDGYTNLDEYVLGTLPRNGTSFFKPDSVTYSASPARVTFTITADPTWLVQLQQSDNLQAWQNVGFAQSGSTSYTFTDDGSFTGVPPFSVAARTRIYRFSITKQ